MVKKELIIKQFAAVKERERGLRFYDEDNDNNIINTRIPNLNFEFLMKESVTPRLSET